jgi:hypothetical protein
MIRELVEAARRPEYTGENRCSPCTALNLFLAAVLGAVVSRRSKPAGAAVAAVSVGVIYLRGYLVPGTPELTRRYLPPAVLRLFGKDPEPDLASGLDASPGSRADETPPSEREKTGEDPAVAPEDLETYFLEAGILEPNEDDGDLRLTEAFESEWLDAIDAAVASGIDAGAVVAAFGFEDGPAAFELEEKGNGAYALQYGSDESDGGRHNAGMWPSYAALVADVAASRRLGSWLEAWDAYEPGAKGRILGGLRMFLETCPTADGGVELTEETVTSCCSERTVVAGVCTETGDRLFEQPLPGD